MFARYHGVVIAGILRFRSSGGQLRAEDLGGRQLGAHRGPDRGQVLGGLLRDGR
jgi:hypothetical protein